jgi:hypothetical protein
MRIVKLGEVPKIEIYPAKCRKCTTEFEALESDAFSVDMQEIAVLCPLCKEEVTIPQVKKESRDIKEMSEHNKLVAYILAKWDKLPKSSFNDDECVIFDCAQNDDYGYGNHSYEGYGVDSKGNIVVCSSSGCSCDGSCCMEPYTVTVESTKLEFNNYDPETIDFGSLEVSFSDY